MYVSFLITLICISIHTSCFSLSHSHSLHITNINYISDIHSCKLLFCTIVEISHLVLAVLASLIFCNLSVESLYKGLNSTQTCVQNFLEVGQHVRERCDTARVLLRKGCPFDRLEDPRGSTVLLKNRKITFHPKEQRHRRQHRQVTQLQPQTVLLHLRPGGCLKICIHHLCSRRDDNTIFMFSTEFFCFFFIKELCLIKLTEL